MKNYIRAFAFKFQFFQESSKARCTCNPKHLRIPSSPSHEQPSHDIIEGQDSLHTIAAGSGTNCCQAHLTFVSCHDPNGNEDASKASRNCVLRFEKLIDHNSGPLICKRIRKSWLMHCCTTNEPRNTGESQACQVTILRPQSLLVGCQRVTHLHVVNPETHEGPSIACIQKYLMLDQSPSRNKKI